MGLRKFIHERVYEVIKETNFWKKQNTNIYVDVEANSSITGEDYILQAEMEIEPYEPETREHPGYGGGTNSRIYKAISKSGEVINGEDEVKNLFSEQDWEEINKDLEIEFNKKLGSYDFDEGPDQDDIRDMRMDMDLKGINEFIQEEILKLHKTTLLETKKSEIEKELKFLKEDYENQIENDKKTYAIYLGQDMVYSHLPIKRLKSVLFSLENELGEDLSDYIILQNGTNHTKPANLLNWDLSNAIPFDNVESLREKINDIESGF